MKKLVLSAVALFTALIVITGCSASKNATTTSVGRGKITGTWTVTSVTYDGLLSNSVQSVFDQAPPKAFEGSTWVLTNSGNGAYTLTNGQSQTIFWSIYDNNIFQFKKIYEGDKAKNVDAGYRLEIANADGSNLTLKTPVQYGGKTGYVVYQLAKK